MSDRLIIIKKPGKHLPCDQSVLTLEVEIYPVRFDADYQKWTAVPHTPQALKHPHRGRMRFAFGMAQLV
ncbi:uncharacterized protein FOMMEDRAFT_19609 [Fomitiporia mediterranea MF3/22]|uniref:uncharacterized protein n=1 Tax=Fomitiporia mediterranea (strain MF3/22) TaxID=694068 RepID=UPI00044097EC|nr:uncharacterized protein FOMMEDRAFT_19609 [Fomitiporia mediterranea MF3/22]EJD04364.1 hypothetical protein FOMMEDRAFT_19609 [Fomitiporia mediterranea MF3/22]